MKLYDSKEIRAILKIAAENSLADESDSQTGLSIDEIRQLASEVGIDPKEITRAAAEIEANSKRIEHNFWGGPFSYSNQVLVEGEITVAQWEEMLLSIREFFQSNGKVTTRDSVLEWSSPWGTTNSAQVTALKDNGKTRLSVNWNGPLTGIPFYIPVPLVAIASIFFASEFLALTAVPGVAFTIFATGLTFVLGRWKLRKHLDKGFKKLREMITGLETIASREISQSELDLKKKDAKHVPNDTSDSLKNILIDENPKESDSEAANRNRSRT